MPTAAQPVPRIGRVLDLVALLLVVGGALAYARAWAGMRALEGLVGPSGAMGVAMTEFDRWWRLSRLAAGIFAAGLIAAALAAVVARQVRRARATGHGARATG